MGGGYQNTLEIDAYSVAPNNAVKQCLGHVSNGFHAWFLSTRNEIYAMYQTLRGTKNIGEFVSERYWSSTKLHANEANDLFMPTSGAYFRPKNNEQCVPTMRAIY